MLHSATPRFIYVSDPEGWIQAAQTEISVPVWQRGAVLPGPCTGLISPWGPRHTQQPPKGSSIHLQVLPSHPRRPALAGNQFYFQHLESSM